MRHLLSIHLVCMHEYRTSNIQIEEGAKHHCRKDAYVQAIRMVG
ncbi:MAG: hypothetical protein PUF36_03430 [Prevotella sp.]|nr:hypothetical protein [Prevotella sp.]